MSLLRKIARTGRVAEPTPSAPTSEAPTSAPPGGESAADQAPATAPDASVYLSGSVQLRHVDAGSCNGCEIEIGSAFGPVYDAERYGLRIVASPRHADALLVTGPVTRNMADPLRATYDATPSPKRVVAVGDCALSCGVFAGGHGVEGAVRDVVPVDVEVPGCPPTPDQLVAALRRLTGR